VAGEPAPACPRTSVRYNGRCDTVRAPTRVDGAGVPVRSEPGPRQQRALLSHCGAGRFAYNWAVSWVRAVWDQRSAEQSYGIPQDGLTPWRAWSLPALRKAWNQVKSEVAPWWAENMGVPRRKRKHGATPACRFTTGTIRVEPDRRHVTLPRLGTIKTHESTRKLARRLEAGTARVLSATVSHRAGRWFVAFQVEIHRADAAPAHPDRAVDRDVNAARNLAQLVRDVESGGSGTGVAGDPDTAVVAHGGVSNGRGADRQTTPRVAGGRWQGSVHPAARRRVGRGPSTGNGGLR